MASVLFTLPWYDLGTSYLSVWTEELIKKANQNKHAVSVLRQDRVTRPNFEMHLKKSRPTYVHMNAHGNSATLAGHDHEPILDASNAVLTKDTVIYARACSSAAILGERCVEAGAVCYIGYVKPFIFNHDLGKIQKSKEDKIAAYALGPSNKITQTLLSGGTTGDAVSSSQAMSRKHILELMSSDAPEGASHILMTVFSNMRNLRLIGDERAKI